MPPVRKPTPNVVVATQLLNKKITILAQKIENLTKAMNNRMDTLAIEVSKVTETALATAFTENPTFGHLIQSLNDEEFAEIKNTVKNQAADVKELLDINEARVQDLLAQNKLKNEINMQTIVDRIEENNKQNKRDIANVLGQIEQIKKVIIGV